MIDGRGCADGDSDIGSQKTDLKSANLSSSLEVGIFDMERREDRLAALSCTQEQYNR